MPQITKTQEVTTSQVVDVAMDGAGETIQPGDLITITLKVTRVRPIMHMHTGLEFRQDVELARVHDDGYLEHFLVCDSTLCSKCK
jgi:hypothetical protein